MNIRIAFWLGIFVAVIPNVAVADWPQFRGPKGDGVSDAKNMPVTWSATDNILWQRDLPGLGSSSPVWVKDVIFVTCYSGYDRWERSKDFSQLKLHVVCLDANDGGIRWTKTLRPRLPLPVGAFGGTRWHGYATGTPAADEHAVYAFFDKTGVFAFDHDGEELWQTQVGDKFHVWGSGTSPILSGDLLILNACHESGSLIALNKKTGDEVWKQAGISKTWGAPLLFEIDGNAQVALMVAGGVEAFDPQTGTRLWSCEGMRDYVCNTPVFHEGVLYCASMNTHGGSNTMAIRPPRNDQAEPEMLWSVRPGPAVSSPVFADGNLYFTNLNQRTGRQVWCLSAKDGQTVYRTIFDPAPGVIYASPLLADGKLYYVSEKEGTFVVAAQTEFKLLAHNIIATDDSVFNASPAPLGDGKLLLRSDKRLYCIGQSQ
jgi:hypothetical protein